MNASVVSMRRLRPVLVLTFGIAAAVMAPRAFEAFRDYLPPAVRAFADAWWRPALVMAILPFGLRFTLISCGMEAEREARASEARMDALREGVEQAVRETLAGDPRGPKLTRAVVGFLTAGAGR